MYPGCYAARGVVQIIQDGEPSEIALHRWETRDASRQGTGYCSRRAVVLFLEQRTTQSRNGTASMIEALRGAAFQSPTRTPNQRPLWILNFCFANVGERDPCVHSPHFTQKAERTAFSFPHYVGEAYSSYTYHQLTYCVDFDFNCMRCMNLAKGRAGRLTSSKSIRGWQQKLLVEPGSCDSVVIL